MLSLNPPSVKLPSPCSALRGPHLPKLFIKIGCSGHGVHIISLKMHIFILQETNKIAKPHNQNLAQNFFRKSILPLIFQCTWHLEKIHSGESKILGFGPVCASFSHRLAVDSGEAKPCGNKHRGDSEDVAFKSWLCLRHAVWPWGRLSYYIYQMGAVTGTSQHYS